MKKNILMVYPEFPTTYWSLKYALSFINKKSAIIPLGLLTVAALLPEEYSVKLIDMNVSKLSEKDIKNADMVFISSMIVQKTSFEEVVALCNALKVPVVAGGPYPTTSYEKIQGIDYFVLNEAEITLPEFIHDYEKGTPQRIYLNKEKPDITKTPPPRIDLVDIKNYNNIALQNSRGCPYNCEFCDIIELFGRKPRYKNVDQFIREMDIVYDQGFRGSLFIVDDNFIGNKKKVKELLKGIVAWQKKRKFPFTFFTEASINLADDDELLQLMSDARFDMAFVGIETPDKEALAACGKNQNVKVNLFDSIEKIQRAGIEVSGGFIVGFDEDEADIFERQISFIQKAGIPMAMVGILGALPDTQLYKRLKRENRLKKESGFSGNNTHNLRMSFIPIMNENTLIKGYKKIISEIYDPKKYFERCYTFLRRLPKSRSQRNGKIDLLQLRALFLSLFRQIFSPYSKYYCKFLLKVILHRPSFFPLAIELSIKGYHFFIITQDILKADELSSTLKEENRKLIDIYNELLVPNHNKNNDITQNIEKLILAKKRLVKSFFKSGKDLQDYLDEEFNNYIYTYKYYLPIIIDFFEDQSLGKDLRIKEKFV